MDHARKIGREEYRNSVFKIRSEKKAPQATCCTLQNGEQHLQEDRRLVNWKRWLADRQKRQSHLAASLKREPMDLALNAHEFTRIKNETRCMVNAAAKSEITNQDKYRGNPIFWQVDERLVKCKEEEDKVDLFAIASNVEKNLPPKLTRVALPNFIKKEKGFVETCLNRSKINLNNKWERGDYLQRRKSELKKEMQFLEPKIPEMEELMVVGKKFQSGDQVTFERTPVITITMDEKKKKLTNADERAILKIQDREFVLEKARHYERLSCKETSKLQETKEDLNERKYTYAAFESDRVYRIISKNAKPIIWTLNFQTLDNELCERKLKLENKGVMVINLDWRDVTPKFTPIQIPERFDSCFFFNKNPISILPGQKVEIPIWFSSKLPIVATETWKLISQPNMYPGMLKVRFWAVAAGNAWRLRELSNSQNVKEQLSRRVCDSKIREILEELLLVSTSEDIKEDIPYHMFFLELDVFQARNPSYFYNSVLVNELKQMHKDVTADETEAWDLSLLQLRSILLKIENLNARREKLIRFRDICLKLLRPNLEYERSDCSKIRLAYWLLCDLVNRFEDESEYVIKKCCSSEMCENYESVDCRRNDVEQDDAEFSRGEGEDISPKRNFALIREMLYIRIACLLHDTIGKISNTLETPSYFNKVEVH